MRYFVTAAGRTFVVEIGGGVVLVDGRAVDAELRSVPGTPVRHLLLDVLLTSNRLRKALSLHSGHGGRALSSHPGLVDGFADACCRSSDLPYLPGHSVVLPERLLELFQARIKRRLRLSAPVYLPLMSLKQLRKLGGTLGRPPISFINHRLRRPSRLSGAVDDCLRHLLTELSHFG